MRPYLRPLVIASTASLFFACAETQTTTDPPVLPLEVTLTPASIQLNVGESVGLTAIVKNGKSQGVTFASSNTAVVTVNSAGAILGISPGIATVTATANENPVVKASSAVTVKTPPKVSITTPQAVVEAGSTLQLTVTVTGAADATVLYKSSVV